MQLAAIHRHPIKALGTEEIPAVALRAGETLPGDREWALAHAGTPFDPAAPAWTRCSAFLRGATFPTLMAVTAETGAAGALTLRHPALAPVTADPRAPEGEAAILAFAAALLPEAAPAPVRLARVPGRGMTDSPEPTLSILSDASRRALSEHAGRRLDRRRFRGNLWLEGLGPWEEIDWVGRRLRLGGAVLRVTEPLGRCSATHADPETGRRDLDLLALLERVLGTTDFGVLAEVEEGGPVAAGDAPELLGRVL